MALRMPLSVSLAPEVRAALEAQATATGQPVSRIVEASVRRVFGLPESPLPPQPSEGRKVA